MPVTSVVPVKVKLPPGQTEPVAGLTKAKGSAATVTKTSSVELQPSVYCRRTVYLVVAEGLAVTVAPLPDERPTVGVQLKEEIFIAAVVAVSVVEFPAQIVTFKPAFTGGLGFATTFTV